MARRAKTGRDMAITMVLVVLVVFAVAWLGWLRPSFSPGVAATGALPSAGYTNVFSAVGTNVGFTPVVPHGVPASWKATSDSVDDQALDGPKVVPTLRSGWITPQGSFITLIESSGDVATVLTDEVGSVGANNGAVTAGGAKWSVTNGVRDEVAWIRSSGGVTILITGDASNADFTTLAGTLG